MVWMFLYVLASLVMLCMLKDDKDAFLSKYKKLNEAVVGVIEDYSLVSFIPLHVEVGYYMHSVISVVVIRDVLTETT